MRKTIAVLLLLVAANAFADAADEVRQTEIAFAKAFADRDQAKFFSFVAEDAHFLSAKSTLNGKAAVVERWSGFFADKTPPFSWHPDRVVTNAAGTLGLSTGPVLDPSGATIAIYSSVWQRDASGAWKIVFDGPGGAVCR